jgi:Dolichyl-phosphate-mannose-protein mannosyltransferase
MQDERQGHSREIAAFVVGALAWRVAFLLAAPRVIDSSDAIHYMDLARAFAAGNLLETGARIPMLYPAACALMHLIVPDIEWASRLVSLAASSALVIPVYLLARDMHGRSAARVAALLVCINPWLADYGCRVATEALASLVWFSAVLALARSLRKGGVWLGIAPLLFFALHLARPEGTFLMFFAPVAGIALCAYGGEGRPKRLVPFVAIAAVLMLFYALYLKAATGHAGINVRVTSPGQAAALLTQGVQLVKNAFELLSKTTIMTGPVLLLFAGVGLFRPANGGRGRDLRLEAMVLLFAAAQFALVIPSGSAAPRYIMAIVIAVSFWAARGLAIVTEQAAGLPRARWLRVLPLGVTVALALATMAAAIVPEYMARLPYQPREYKIAGLWMKENLEPALVIARKPEIGFYADMETSGPGEGETLQETVTRLRAAGARYLVVDERYTTQLFPEWLILLDPAQAPGYLRLLKDGLSPYPDGRIVIYALAEDGP